MSSQRGQKTNREVVANSDADLVAPHDIGDPKLRKLSANEVPEADDDVIQELPIDAEPPRSHFPWKAIVGLIIVAVIAVGVFLSSTYVRSAQAVNKYISDIDKQYKEISDDKNVEQNNAKLEDIWLADQINPRYRKVKALDSDYQKMINRLKNYTVVINLHNKMVKKFNSGINGKKDIDGDLLELVGKIRDEIADRYPDEKERSDKVGKLYDTIAASTNFDEISSQANEVLHMNDTWLSQERDAVEKQRQTFQQHINAT